MLCEKSAKENKEKDVIKNAWQKVAESLDFTKDGNEVFCKTATL